MEFKGTKGKWELSGTDIISENIKGLLFTAWSVYNTDEIEQRINEETWLDMRKRTQQIRIEKDVERRANALLISKAPEMLNELENIVDCWDKNVFQELDIDVIRKLIKEATELW
jgi:hypothetical protein